MSISRESKKKFSPKMAFFTFYSKNGLKTQYVLKSMQKCNLNCGFRPVMKFSVRHALIIKREGQVFMGPSDIIMRLFLKAMGYISNINKNSFQKSFV